MSNTDPTPHPIALKRNPVVAEDFLLDTRSAQRLYHGYAAGAPIVDYHNHLSAADIADDRSFETITPLWLETDHYKWRAMRANGIDEVFITGTASDYDRFERWAATVPQTFRNPLFHWTHLELGRAFDVADLLTPDTSRRIYDATSTLLATADFTTRRLVERAGARILCTTDDPSDGLDHHRRLRDDPNFAVTVLPTFRGDRALGVSDPHLLNTWLDALGERADLDIRTFADLIAALEKRHNSFHAAGCRLADHGLETFSAVEFDDDSVARTFGILRAGRIPDADRATEYRSAVCYHLARMNHEKGWAQQYHVGPIRNVSTRIRKLIGVDAGCDSIGDWNHARSMARFFDRLDRDGILARTILYNANPRDNALFATMAGNFNDASVPGKMQYGPPWWFLDHMHGIVDHLNTLSNYGLLSRFIGMVTDSRSLLSLYSRHDYFRRVLCRVLGREMEKGLLPGDEDWIGRVVRSICSENAVDYLGLERSGAA